MNVNQNNFIDDSSYSVNEQSKPSEKPKNSHLAPEDVILANKINSISDSAIDATSKTNAPFTPKKKIERAVNLHSSEDNDIEISSFLSLNSPSEVDRAQAFERLDSSALGVKDRLLSASKKQEEQAALENLIKIFENADLVPNKDFTNLLKDYQGKHSDQEVIKLLEKFFNQPYFKDNFEEILSSFIYILDLSDYFQDTKGAILEPGIQILIDYLQDKNSIKDIDIKALQYTDDLLKELNSLNSSKNSGFIVKAEGSVHWTPVFVYQEEGQTHVVITDSVGMEDLYGWKIAEKIAIKFPHFHISLYKDLRQIDSINCSIFALRDLAHLSRNPSIIKQAERIPGTLREELMNKVKSFYPHLPERDLKKKVDLHIKREALDELTQTNIDFIKEIPAEHIKMAQSVRRIQSHSQKDELILENKKTQQKENLEETLSRHSIQVNAPSRPGQKKVINRMLADRGTKYRSLVLAHAVTKTLTHVRLDDIIKNKAELASTDFLPQRDFTRALKQNNLLAPYVGKIDENDSYMQWTNLQCPSLYKTISVDHPEIDLESAFSQWNFTKEEKALFPLFFSKSDCQSHGISDLNKLNEFVIKKSTLMFLYYSIAINLPEEELDKNHSKLTQQVRKACENSVGLSFSTSTRKSMYEQFQNQLKELREKGSDQEEILLSFTSKLFGSECKIHPNLEPNANVFQVIAKGLSENPSLLEKIKAFKASKGTALIPFVIYPNTDLSLQEKKQLINEINQWLIPFENTEALTNPVQGDYKASSVLGYSHGDNNVIRELVNLRENYKDLTFSHWPLNDHNQISTVS